MAVNPDQLSAQMESNMAWSVGMALIERLQVADDNITSSNFDNYPIVRMAEMPSVDTKVIDQPTIPPAGAGEVALIAGPPAIANATAMGTLIKSMISSATKIPAINIKCDPCSFQVRFRPLLRSQHVPARSQRR